MSGNIRNQIAAMAAMVPKRGDPESRGETADVLPFQVGYTGRRIGHHRPWGCRGYFTVARAKVLGEQNPYVLMPSRWWSGIYWHLAGGHHDAAGGWPSASRMAQPGAWKW